MSETSPDHNTPPSNEIACPAAFEPAAATWEAELVSLSRDPHRAITMPCATIRHWGLLHESPWGLRPACDAPPPSLVMGAPPHVFAARAGVHPDQYCQHCAKSAERAHWDQVDAGLLVEWDTCASADTLLRFAGLIGVAPAMVDIARSSVYAEHSREQCKDYHGDRVRQLIPRIVVAEALARNRIQKPQSARGEADGQDLATAEGERS